MKEIIDKLHFIKIKKFCSVKGNVTEAEQARSCYRETLGLVGGVTAVQTVSAGRAAESAGRGGLQPSPRGPPGPLALGPAGELGGPGKT